MEQEDLVGPGFPWERGADRAWGHEQPAYDERHDRREDETWERRNGRGPWRGKDLDRGRQGLHEDGAPASIPECRREPQFDSFHPLRNRQGRVEEQDDRTHRHGFDDPSELAIAPRRPERRGHDDHRGRQTNNDRDITGGRRALVVHVDPVGGGAPRHDHGWDRAQLNPDIRCRLHLRRDDANLRAYGDRMGTVLAFVRVVAVPDRDRRSIPQVTPFGPVVGGYSHLDRQGTQIILEANPGSLGLQARSRGDRGQDREAIQG